MRGFQTGWLQPGRPPHYQLQLALRLTMPEMLGAQFAKLQSFAAQ